MTLFGKPGDQEDGRPMSQNNHLTESGCQFLKREGEEVRKFKRPFILKNKIRGVYFFFLQ